MFIDYAVANCRTAGEISDLKSEISSLKSEMIFDKLLSAFHDGSCMNESTSENDRFRLFVFSLPTKGSHHEVHPLRRLAGLERCD